MAKKAKTFLGNRKTAANQTKAFGKQKVAYEVRKSTIGKELKLLNKQNKVGHFWNTRNLLFIICLFR